MTGALALVGALLAAQIQTHPTGLKAVGLSHGRRGVRTVQILDKLYEQAGKPSLDLDFARYGDLHDNATGATSLVTFSRSAASSPGTYVGSDGLIKEAAVNLQLYSEEFDQWTNSNTTDLANQVDAPDGKQTADEIEATAANGTIVRGVTTTAIDYTFSVYLKRKTGTGDIDISVDGTTWVAQSVTVDWQRFVVTQTGVAGTSNAGIRIVTSGDEVYAWGAQLEEGTIATPYIPTTSQALAAARFDHDPLTGESLGLLVEEQRTNLWTYSGDPDSLSWGLFGVTRRTTSPIAAPDGTSISTVFDFSAAPGRAIEKSIAVSGNNTVSAYLRTESGTETMYFTLNNGSNIYSQPFTVTDEWQRFSFTLDTTGGTGVVAIRNGAAGGAKSVYAWGVQYEAGASPTSYIPTTSAAMTRAADIATIEGADFASWYNSTDGTGYGEFDRENPGSSLVQVLFHFAGPVGRFALYEHVPALAASGFYNLGVSACPVGTFCKHSGAFSGGGSGTESSAFDGVVVVGEAGTVNPDVNKLYIGSRPTGQQLNGHIKRLTYWNTRLPDANLGAITS
jgi:hypothetical protein